MRTGGGEDSSSSMLQVTLTVLDGGDNETDKVFTRRDGDEVVLVRASKTAGEVPSSDNAMFRNQVMSRQHAKLLWMNGGVAIKDNNSTHGTVIHRAGPTSPAVEAKSVTWTRLYDGNIIVLGKTINRLDSSDSPTTYHPIRIRVGIRPVLHGLSSDAQNQAATGGVVSNAQRKYALSRQEQLFTDEELDEIFIPTPIRPYTAAILSPALPPILPSTTATQSHTSHTRPIELLDDTEGEMSVEISRDNSIAPILDNDVAVTDRSASEELDVVAPPMLGKKRRRRRLSGQSPLSLSRNSSPAIPSGAAESTGESKESQRQPIPSAGSGSVAAPTSAIAKAHVNNARTQSAMPSVATTAQTIASQGVTPWLAALQESHQKSTSASNATRLRSASSTEHVLPVKGAVSSATAQLQSTKPPQYIVIDDEDVDTLDIEAAGEDSIVSLDSLGKASPVAPDRPRNTSSRITPDARSVEADPGSDSGEDIASDEELSTDDDEDLDGDAIISSSDSDSELLDDQELSDDDSDAMVTDGVAEGEIAGASASDEEEDEDEETFASTRRRKVRLTTAAELSMEPSDDEMEEDEISEASSQIFDTVKEPLSRTPLETNTDPISDPSEAGPSSPDEQKAPALERVATEGMLAEAKIPATIAHQEAGMVHRALSATQDDGSVLPMPVKSVTSSDYTCPVHARMDELQTPPKATFVDTATQSHSPMVSSASVQTALSGKEVGTQVEMVAMDNETTLVAESPGVKGKKRKLVELEGDGTIRNTSVVDVSHRPKKGLPWRSALTFTAGAVATLVGLALIPEMD